MFLNGTYFFAKQISIMKMNQKLTTFIQFQFLLISLDFHGGACEAKVGRLQHVSCISGPLFGTVLCSLCAYETI
jgi:hypothetical protein